MTVSGVNKSTRNSEEVRKVLETFCAIASRFEQDMAAMGFLEVTHLLSISRMSAEESIYALGKKSVGTFSPHQY